jgi:hypothetical protein
MGIQNPSSVTSPGDLSDTSFSLTNNQASVANVTGFTFSNSISNGAVAIYAISISATTPLFESGTLQMVQKSSSWEMSQISSGDNSQVVLTVTPAGQIQYTTPSYTGFTSGTIKFRASSL